MPISGPSSYLTVSDEFISHWNICNTALGVAGPLELPDGEEVADLIALRVTLVAQWADVEDARNGREFTRADIEIKKAALLERLNQFNTKIRAVDTSGLWTRLLPKAFGITDGLGKVFRALDDLLSVWTRYQNDGPSSEPLLLVGGYGLGTFTTQLAALKAAYTAYADADKGLGYVRGLRNMTQASIYAILKRYRLVAAAEFAEDSAELATLPRLTPLPGSTPEPAVVEAVYNAATEEADVVITLPDDESVVEVELLATVGPEFESEDATSVGTYAAVPGGTVTASTGIGMSLPLGAVSLRAVVRTAEGNERSSNVVTVTRPG